MEVAEVYIWNQLTGAIAWDPERGYGFFEYAPAFRRQGIELAPLTIPLSGRREVYSFPELRSREQGALNTFKGLPGLLADALPDRYGHQLINAWLARQGRPADSMNPVEMLCFIGSRAMGALEFTPALRTEAKRTTRVELSSLVEAAADILERKQNFSTDLDADEHQALNDILKIGTSAGGARPKAVIAWNEKTGEVRSGQTRVPKGFQHWLIKLDGVSDAQFGESSGYGRVEMAYHDMATDCGIDMMPCRLLEENGRAHFMTLRFDREGAETKHHVQTFCAMKHYDYNLVGSFSYEQLFQTMRELKLDYRDAEQMFRRMVFNVIARNCDDHTKNFAFMLIQSGKWQLAPAYDICHAYRPDSTWVSKHALSINGKREDITREDLLVIGRSIRCKNAADILEQTNEVVNRWRDYASRYDVRKDLRERIGDTHRIL
jgi:serine/threonine-protein kinase HipA